MNQNHIVWYVRNSLSEEDKINAVYEYIKYAALFGETHVWIDNDKVCLSDDDMKGLKEMGFIVEYYSMVHSWRIEWDEA